ncbi:MAG: prolyl oligopeptidase family serine peptidase [Vicinamibacterales bacterium]
MACAEYLIAKGYTSPAHLAGESGSAGGILIGRALEEHPDLSNAARARWCARGGPCARRRRIRRGVVPRGSRQGRASTPLGSTERRGRPATSTDVLVKPLGPAPGLLKRPACAQRG